MDTGTFRGLITLILIVAFIGICLWAYSKRRKPDFDEAANLPFADDNDKQPTRDKHASSEHEVDSRHDRGDKNT
ncbi:cbb3-type cytochrome oxidase subunit 3 [Vreelandella venusta]|uniref:Cbb3-type cytochrome c oxidase subunit 3 n=1 Tax=Vreelandella venusta TaxID=44935 RepID=A0AAP9ZD62_9GAMM|nr:cbb3-type cytochrome c oxidase subunit 3 [Halomonas venusta]MBR9925944.1 cbb3-type cytochrome c oxidase subunit 3 [Gammaproteobacteria bacterium]AZM97119.1 cbb3-type cytochrome c oxidase subunit 3 [Halomonas venusta]MDW0359692.1 cbb3-type cytochrome c oxidase subunit 3 [Halomonas venusta]MDX1355307.1 cbb3-type cytochrome c oxidase subunit 3 [Halomonas venusta]MDX1714969.1 cbb3-type cytochrome c oxidase subunit 3 [Halomonas venusta]